MSKTDGVRVLLVDDNEATLLAYQAALEEVTVDFVVARSGQEALDHIAAGDFAAVLLDVGLPDTDGFTVAESLRRRRPETPVLFLTGRSDLRFVERAWALGAVDFLEKPVLPAMLRAKVSIFVALARRNGEVQALNRRLAEERELLQAILDNIEAGVAACDAGGALTLFNRAAREMLGASEVPVPPERWADHYHVTRSDGVTRLSVKEMPLYLALTDGEVRNAELVVNTSGFAHKLIVSGRAIFGSGGEKVGAVVAMHDITALKEAEDELRQAHDRLERTVQERTSELALIMDNVPACISYVDSSQRYRSVNRGYEQLLGATRSELIGRHVRDVFGEQYYEQARDRIERVLAGERVSFEALAPVAGHDRWLNATYTPDIDINGNVRGFVVMASDITAQKRAGQLLLESEERLRLAQESADLGVWDWDLRTNKFTWSERIYELLGIETPEVSLSLEIFAGFIHPDDRSRVLEEVQQAIHSGSQLSTEFRVILRDGSTRWLLSRARVFRDAAAQPVRMIGLNMDLTDRKDSERALRESEARLSAIVSQATAGIAETDLSGRFQLVNDRYCEMVGRTREDLLTLHMQDITHPDDLIENQPLFEAAALRRQPFVIEKRYVKPDGAFVWVTNSVSALTGDDGSVQGIIAVSVDITERVSAQRKLEFLDTLAEAARELSDPAEVMVTITRLLGTHLRVSHCSYADVETDNERFTILHDFTAEGYNSTVGCYKLSLFGSGVAAELRAGRIVVIRDVNAEQQSCVDGDMFRTLSIGAAICCPLLKNGRVTSLMAVHQSEPRNWTQDEINLVEATVERAWAYIERSRAVRTLRESEERFRTLADNIPNLAWMADASGWIFWYNQRWYEYTGTNEADMEGWGWQSVHDPENLPDVMARWKHSIATGEPFSMVFPLRRADGRFRPYLTLVMPIRDEEGRVVRWFGTNTDITEQEEARAAIRQSEERLRAAVLGAPFPIMLHAEDGEVLALSRCWLVLSGYSADELRTHFDWIARAYPDRTDELTRMIESEFRSDTLTERRELSLRTKDGRTRIWDVQGVALGRLSDGRRVRMSAAVDITERAHFEEQLKGLADAAVALNSAPTVSGAMTVATEKAREVVGAHQAVSSLTSSEIWAQAVHHISLSDKYAQWRDYTELPDGTGIYSLICRTNRPMRMTQPELEAHPAWRGFGRHSAGHPPLRGWLAAPLKDSEGRNLGVIQLSDKYEGDFTEADEAILVQLAEMASVAIGNASLSEYLKKTNEELRRANEDLNQFAFSASHDLQEPLRNVAVYSQLLKRNYGPLLDARAHEFMDYLVEGSHRMSELVRDLLAYMDASNASAHASPVSAEAVLGRVIAGMSASIQESSAAITSANLPAVTVQEVHLQQLFQNLIGNAIKYRSEEPPRIHISAGTENGYHVFSVRDNGIGIDPRYAKQVFGIFKRLHGRSSYSGTGIGLAICQKIVERYGGRIWVESEGRGKGADFRFTLPL